MKGFVLPAVVALAFAASAAMTRAEDAKPAEKQTATQPADSKASSDQIIQQLTPPAGTPPLRFRGLHLLTSQPAATAQMPAVRLAIKFKTNSAPPPPGPKGPGKPPPQPPPSRPPSQ